MSIFTKFGLLRELLNLYRPKRDLAEGNPDFANYLGAEDVGNNHGDCWSFYPRCAYSIFNIVPDIYTRDDEIQVTFKDVESGTESIPQHGKADSGGGAANGQPHNLDDLMSQEAERLDDNIKEFMINLDLTKD